MNEKKSSLDAALERTAGRNAPPQRAKGGAGAAKSVQAGREGKKTLSVWLEKEFKQGLTMLKARRELEEPPPFMDDLVAEALNDLFEKYGIPTVRREPRS